MFCASDDADFGVTSFQVIFDESSTDVGSVACYEVPIDDDLIELEEMFFAEIVPLNNEDMIIGNSTSPTLTVVDDDGGFHVRQSFYRFIEWFIFYRS